MLSVPHMQEPVSKKIKLDIKYFPMVKECLPRTAIEPLPFNFQLLKRDMHQLADEWRCVGISEVDLQKK